MILVRCKAGGVVSGISNESENTNMVNRTLCFNQHVIPIKNIGYIFKKVPFSKKSRIFPYIGITMKRHK